MHPVLVLFILILIILAVLGIGALIWLILYAAGGLPT
jgi:hypothetical protein